MLPPTNAFGPTGHGGGHYHNAGTTIPRHSTVAGNSPSVTGVGLYLNGGVLAISHTLLAIGSGNFASGGGSVNREGCNLADGSSAAAFAAHAGTLLIGPLVHNGDPTPTHARLPGSPAIDAGTNAAFAGLSFDQRGPGYPRPIGSGLDIGPFELQATSAPLSLAGIARTRAGHSGPTPAGS